MNGLNMDAFRELLPAYVAGTLDVAGATSMRKHLETCAQCLADTSEWELVRSAAHRAAAGTPMPSRGVLERVFAKIDGRTERVRWQERWIPGALRRPLYERSLAAVAAVVVLALAVTLTPIGSYAQSLFQTLQPKQFVVVPVTLADLQSLPSLVQYGTFAEGAKGKPQVSLDAVSASTAAGMTVLTPTSLPASVTAAPTYIVVPSYSGTFTFSAAKAVEAAKAQGKPLPTMPANIDRSTVQLTTGAGAIAVYGGNANAFGMHQGSATPAPTATTSGAGAILGAEAIPQLIVAQAFAPVATATGAPVKDLEQYLLSQPGITANLARAIRAIGDPTSIWPIPVPLGKVNTRSVTVQGSAATVFSDVSGFAAGVVWVKDGVIHIVGGPLSESDVLKVAASLR